MILYPAFATLPLHTSDGIDDCVDWTLLVPQNRMQPYYNCKKKQSNIINSIMQNTVIVTVRVKISQQFQGTFGTLVLKI